VQRLDLDPGVAAFWRPDIGNRLRVHHLGAVLAWPLCGQNWRFWANEGNSHRQKAGALSGRIDYVCEDFRKLVGATGFEPAPCAQGELGRPESADSGAICSV